MKKILFILIIILIGCTKEHIYIDREFKIPTEKILVEDDLYPPILHSNEYEKPVPLPYPVNTAGAEDSPFFYQDTLFFFFTPDVTVPVEKQVIDDVTGIYSSTRHNGQWSKPIRVHLQKPGKLSLDGCPYINNNIIWFCTAREGYTGLHWFTAKLKDSKWTDYTLSDFNSEYEVGELHFHNNYLYYHSTKSGGKGQNDIWMLELIDTEWKNPLNLEIINTPENEMMPFITKDGNELWFNRNVNGTPAIFRSKKINNEWVEPELIISQFAGEPNLDNEGNIYFIHHYYKNSIMLEADIYIAKKIK